jgi:hypothetical protein
MTDYLVHAIYKTLIEFGEPVLSTPSSLEVVLRRLSKASPGELHAIAAAVKHGGVQDLRNRPNGNVEALATSLANRSGLPIQAAKWSLDVWKKSLHHFDTKQPPPEPIVDHLRDVYGGPPPMAHYRLGVATTILVGLVGLMAGLLPGIIVPFGVQHQDPQAVRVRQLIERREQSGTRMTDSEFRGWIGSLGALGGLIGSVVGWLGGGFHRPTATRVLAGVIGALWAFDGAIFGVAYAGIIGTLFGSMFVATVMTYLASSLGAWGLLLICKPAAWFVLPHFA